MNKPLAIVLAVIGWAGVVVVQNFHEIVPHASEDEIAPFKVPIVIFALVCTVLVIRAFTAKPK